MFGYVRPSLGRLSQEDTARFSAMYCGLCRALGRRCGKAASLILNYDFTFLAVLLADVYKRQPLDGEQFNHAACLFFAAGTASAMSLSGINLEILTNTGYNKAKDVRF